MRVRFRHRHCVNGEWYAAKKWHEIDGIEPADLERWLSRGQVEVDETAPKPKPKKVEAAAFDGAPETAAKPKATTKKKASK